MEHRFTGPSFTLGIEEELMIVDHETLELQNSIETMLEAMPQAEGQVKPELMESVCEVATTPCKNTREAGDQLRELRRKVQETANDKGLAIASAIFWVCSGLGSPSIPNHFFWNDPRWSNARMNSLPS